MPHPKNPGYISGENWDTCDRCDMEFYNSEMLYEWNGLFVCEDCWEPRHEQDFLRMKDEKVSADDPGTQSDDSKVLDSGAVSSMDGNRTGSDYSIPTPTHSGGL